MLRLQHATANFLDPVLGWRLVQESSNLQLEKMSNDLHAPNLSVDPNDVPALSNSFPEEEFRMQCSKIP